MSVIIIISESVRYGRRDCIQRRYENSNNERIIRRWWRSRVYSPTSGLTEEREEREEERKREEEEGEREVVGWGREQYKRKNGRKSGMYIGTVPTTVYLCMYLWTYLGQPSLHPCRF